MVVCAGADYPDSCKVMAKSLSLFLEKGKPYSILLLRLILAWRLMAGTWPYVSSAKPVSEVIQFFQTLSLPLPASSAYLSLYAQFACGLLLLMGWQTRIAAFVLLINFSVALVAAHLHDPIESSFQAWALWSISIYFFSHGAGYFSVDKLIDWVSFKSFDIKIDNL
jgi:putative oxidoreductase